jgi:TonB-dependent Receptor Plug Domain
MTARRRAPPLALAFAVACAVAARAGDAAADDPKPAPDGQPPAAQGGATPPRPAEPIEVEVRGARLPAPSRTPASVTVVTRSTLDSLPGGAAQPLPDVLNTQPGFVTDSFGLLHARTNDGGESYVIDGVPLGMLPLGQFQSFVPMRMVQELKVVTGGFPAQYGGGLGAVIEVKTRHPIGGPAGQAQILYGTYQHVAPSFDYSQEIGKLTFLAGGSFETTNRGLDPPAATPILNDAMVKGTGFLRADYAIDARRRIEVLGGVTETHYQIPVDPTALPLPPNAVREPDSYGNIPPAFVPYDAKPTELERDVFAAVAFTRTVGESDVLHVAPYVRESYGLLSCDAAGTLGPTSDQGSSCADLRRDSFHEGAAIDYEWTADDHQRWKTGIIVDVAEGNVGYTSYTRSTSPEGGPDPSMTISGQDRTNVIGGGIYAQDTLTFGRWTVLSGARVDVQYTSYPGSGEPSLSLASPSGRLGVSYAVSDDLVVHAFAGSLWQPPVSIDAPAAARILVPSLAGHTVPVDLKPENDWTAELGVERRLAEQASLGLTGWGRVSKDLLDRQSIGSTNLYESYNFSRGRAAGVEAWSKLALTRWVDGFANLGLQIGQGQGVDSARYLFTPAQLAFTGWQTLDHVQTWTANVALDLHDDGRTSHLSARLNYGSGMRTGADNTLTVPSHSTLDLTLRHRFDLGFHPEVAIDVYNVFNEVYALRIANGVYGSAYGSLRRAEVRLAVPLPL